MNGTFQELCDRWFEVKKLTILHPEGMNEIDWEFRKNEIIEGYIKIHKRFLKKCAKFYNPKGETALANNLNDIIDISLKKYKEVQEAKL